MSAGHVASCLKEFARGTRSRTSLEECIAGQARLAFWDTDQRSSELIALLPKVFFTRVDIDAQLRRFLAGELSARDLSDWAAGMRLLGCFVLEEDDPGSSEAWDLMDEIMSPDAWGPLTVESAIDLRTRLNVSS